MVALDPRPLLADPRPRLHIGHFSHLRPRTASHNSYLSLAAERRPVKSRAPHLHTREFQPRPSRPHRPVLHARNRGGHLGSAPRRARPARIPRTEPSDHDRPRRHAERRPRPLWRRAPVFLLLRSRPEFTRPLGSTRRRVAQNLPGGRPPNRDR